MAFFASAIDTLKILVIALGAGLGAWRSEEHTSELSHRCTSRMPSSA